MFSKSFEKPITKEIQQLHELGKSGLFYDEFISFFDTAFNFEEMKKSFEKENEEEYIATPDQKRKVCKKKILAMLFASSDQFIDIQDIFLKKFPTIMKGINHFKNSVGYEKFSHLLFKIESYFVLDITAKRFYSQYGRYAPVFTLHDCLITTSPYINELNICFNESFTEYLESVPKTEIKEWK